MENVDCELAVALVLGRYVCFDYVACFFMLESNVLPEICRKPLIIIEL
ncbi:hypothetical protein [Maridesulfovibrio sp.]|nr:hypothetical protein [Maridesulfovibrio sp.]